MTHLLSFQREVVIMVRLGDRADALDDRLPVIAFILAVEDIAVRGAGEDRVAAVPRIHRHAFDVGANMFGQSAGQNIPTLTAVTAARDARVRGVEFSPGTRTRLGAVSALEKAADFDSDVDDVGILRMKRDALHVRLMWRSGKSPFLHARHLAQGRQLGPALAKIIAIIQMRRLGARVHAWFSINRLAGEGVNLLIADAAVAPLPILSEISAGVNL